MGTAIRALTRNSTIREVEERLRACVTAQDMAQVLREVRALHRVADQNVYYLIGYQPEPDRSRLQRLYFEA